MDYQGEFTIKYHHGGSLIKGRYCNGRMDEFCVDPDKLCHWDLLEDLKELGHDITKSMDFYYKDSEGSFKLICDDGGILGLVNQIKKFWTSDIYVQSSCGDQQHTLPKVLVNDIVSPGNVDVSVHNVLELDEDDNMNASVGGNFNGNQNLNGDGSGNVIENANYSGNESNSSKEDEEGLIDVPFIDYCSEVDDETENAREKLRKYLQMEKEMKGNNEDDVDSDDDNATEDAFRSEGQPNVAETGRNIDNVKATSEKDEMIGHESDYIDSDDPGSYDDTSDGSDADDARRHKSNKMIYDPTRPLDDFCLDLRFEDLKAFKNELIEFSTKRGFEFKFIKNDSTRVRAKCAAKECKWLIFCSWCSGKKMFVVKHYVADHSCLLGVPKNRRVTAPLIAKKFGEVISSMLSMKARQLRAMVRAQLGVFVTYKVCRNAKNLVIKKIEEQFIEDFKLLNNYALELKSTNPGSTVVVMAENGNPNELPVFQKIYICLHAVKEGFLGGCRRIIGLDGCFLKGLLKGQLLVAVGRDGNNQMFPIAWAVVQKETSETWGWFIENLKSDLCMGEGLGWSLISDMQKMDTLWKY